MCAQFGSVWWDPPLDQVTSSRGIDVTALQRMPLFHSNSIFPHFPLFSAFSQKMELVWIQLKRLSFLSSYPILFPPSFYLASPFCCSFICKLFDIQISVHILLRRLCLFSNVPSGTKHGFCEFGRFLQPLKRVTV